MSRRLFEMSDAELERARESYDKAMYKAYYGDEEEPTCSECTHYCSDGTCERFNDDEDSEDYGEYYVPVNADDEVCDDFEQREHDPWEDEPPDNFDWYEYQEEHGKYDDADDPKYQF